MLFAVVHHCEVTPGESSSALAVRRESVPAEARLPAALPLGCLWVREWLYLYLLCLSLIVGSRSRCVLLLFDVCSYVVEGGGEGRKCVVNVNGPWYVVVYKRIADRDSDRCEKMVYNIFT